MTKPVKKINIDMISFKQFLLENEDYETFLKAHFGSEPAKPESHVLTSKITGGVHKDIPLYIGVDAMSPYPLPQEGKKQMFDGTHPTIKSPKRIHSLIPMTFDSEAVVDHPKHGKIHVVRYNATDAYNTIRSLWNHSDELNRKIAGGRILYKAPDFLNHPILAQDKVTHDDKDISVGEQLRKMHGGTEPYGHLYDDEYAYKQRHTGENQIDIFSFYRKMGKKDDGGGGGFTETPSGPKMPVMAR